jgi:predicted Zn-dependent protease
MTKLPNLKNIKEKILSLITGLLFLFTDTAYALTSYSTEELDSLEKKFVQQINQSDSVERNPLATQYLNQIGKKLGDAANMPPPSFFIVKSNEINAFAGPGGYIGVNTQLILATETESELSGVMAHELAHVRLHHLYQMITHQKQMRIPMMATLLAAVALSAINPALGSGALMATLTGFSQDNINFVRMNEKEADRIGIDILIRSGFNPLDMAGFFKKMQQNSRYYYTANVPAILRTHPMDDDRIAEAQNRSTGFQNKSYSSSKEYYLFKEIIRNSVSSDKKLLLEYYQHHCKKSKQSEACLYGHALSLIHLNQYEKAQILLSKLLEKEENSLFYQIAMARTEIGKKNYSVALKRLFELQNKYVGNYAALMAYAQGLSASGDAEKASLVLLKGSRIFNKDLPLCEALARAQSKANQKAYAYLTHSKCHLLQGRHRDALRQLKLVTNLARKDPYLLARANAMIEEIKFMAGKY